MIGLWIGAHVAIGIWGVCAGHVLSAGPGGVLGPMGTWHGQGGMCPQRGPQAQGPGPADLR